MFLKLPVFQNALSTLSRWGAEIRAQSFLTEAELTLENWEPAPTALAPLTIASTEIIRARYRILGNLAIMFARFNVVTGGVASTTIYLPIPSGILLASEQHSGWGNWGVGGPGQSLVVTQDAQARLALTRGDALNWAAATQYGFNVGAIFELI